MNYLSIDSEIDHLPYRLVYKVIAAIDGEESRKWSLFSVHQTCSCSGTLGRLPDIQWLLFGRGVCWVPAGGSESCTERRKIGWEQMSLWGCYCGGSRVRAKVISVNFICSENLMFVLFFIDLYNLKSGRQAVINPIKPQEFSWDIPP